MRDGGDGNLIKGATYDGRADGTGILAIHTRSSEVAGNGLYDCEVGLYLVVAFGDHVHDNRAKVHQLAYRCEIAGADTFSGNATLSDGEGHVETKWDIGRFASVPGADPGLQSWFSGGDGIIPLGREELP